MRRPGTAPAAILILATAVILATAAGAAEIVPIDAAPGALSVEVLGSDGATTVLEYKLHSFTRESLDIEGEAYYAIDLDGEALILKEGLPELPSIRRSLVIPDDAEMAVRVVSSHYTDFEDHPVAPSKGNLTRNVDPATVAHTFDAIYATDRWYPSELAYAREPYIMRDVRGLVVVLNPFHYNPATRTLRVYDSVTVEVSVIGPGETNVLTHRPATMNSEFRKIYEDHFLNFDGMQGSRYPVIEDAGNMLVICYDDPGFIAAMQPLVEWKKQTGVPCELVTVTDAGGTANGIKNYITQYYNDNDLTFVLLVGDADEVPTLTASGGASDPSYSTITPDMYPELFVGRFSASTVAQVQTQVQRTIEYERTPQAAAAWYHKGMGVASNQGPGDDGEYDNVHVDNIRTDLLGFTYTEVDQIYDPYANPTMVANGLNDGRSIVNYTGHGSTTSWGSSGFSVSNVNALVNDNMLPFIISVACVNGQFTYSTCFAEAWLRATNGVMPTGAVGFYGSSINQSWNPPMDAQDEMNDLLVGTSSYGTRRTFGGLCYNGCGHMMDFYGADGEDMFRTWHIFGDPSLRVRTDTPVDLGVTHAANVDAFASTFEVTAPGVAGALAALYHDGVLYGSALTEASGVATIELLSPMPEFTDITVTVTSFNALTYEGTVYSGGAYVPVISVDPLSFDQSLAPDAVAVDTLSIENTGDPLSNLHYDIEIVAVVERSAAPTGRIREAIPFGFGEGTRDWLELLSPNGGESLPVGSVHNITWDSGGQMGFIRLEHSADSGASWTTIVPGTANDGLYEWTVDGPQSDHCLMRVSMSADPDVYDISDWEFSVFHEVNWLSAVPASGDVTVGSRAAVEVTFDATGLAVGDYFADMIISSNGGDTITVPVALHVSATGIELGEPSGYAIRGVSPNPFNPVTTVTYSVPTDSRVRLVVYDVSGRLVRTLVDGEVEAGHRSVVWDGRDDGGREVGSGVYFCRMEAGDAADAAKMVLLK